MDKILLLSFGSAAILFVPQCASQSIGTEKACNTSSWPDLDHGLVCGDCTALIKNMNSKYITCDSYCNRIGRNCSGAWEEYDDTCDIKTTETCDHKFDYTTDAICECKEDKCCETLTISSSGGTAEHQGHRLGTYRKDGKHNNKQVYKQQQGTNVLFFGGFRWRSGSSFNSDGGLKSKKSKPGKAPDCPSDVKEWLFYDPSTTNTDHVDSTVDVDCEEGNGNQNHTTTQKKIVSKSKVRYNDDEENMFPQNQNNSNSGNESSEAQDSDLETTQACFEYGVNTRGREQLGNPIKVESWTSCSKKCVINPNCIYWTWVHEPSSSYAFNCALMSSFTGKVPDADTISGPKTCQGTTTEDTCCETLIISSSGGAADYQDQRLGTYRKGGKYNNKPFYKQQQGTNKLVFGEVEGSTRWVIGYNSSGGLISKPGEATDCPSDVKNWVFSEPDNKILLVDSTAAVECGEETTQTCFEYGINTMEREQLGNPTKVESWTSCSKKCVLNPNCTYWTWVHKPSSSYAFNCALMSSFARKVPDADTISGPKTCHGLESVKISSSGDGGVHKQNRMGIYIRTSKEVQGFPVYQQKINKLDQEQFLFVGPLGNWRVGPNITTYKGSSLKNEHRSPSPPQTGWQYWKKDGLKGVWINDDSMQAVQGIEDISQTCPETDVTTQGRKQLGNSIKVDTWEDCAKLCDLNPNCTYWTWVHELSSLYAKNCDLLSSFSRKVYDTNTIFGPKTCQGAKYENMERINKASAVAISMIVPVSILTVLILVIYHKRKVKKITENKEDSEENNRKQMEALIGNDISEINVDIPMSSQASLLPFARKFELSREDFSTKHMIGDGQFGMVFIGTAKNIYGSELTEVAIKQVKNMFDDCHFSTIIGELKILSNLDMHMNLVNLLAACTVNVAQKEIYLILELCQHGDLKQFLNKNREDFLSSINYICKNTETSDQKLSPHLLLNWTYCIAKGMEYLSSKNIMHGDLAARNILLDENYVAKISDFGLSKEICYGQDYRKVNRRMIPWAWMALEYLQTGMFNLKSDVWSYGIVLWEIFSLGNKPYCPESYEDVKEKLVGGYHLPAPDHMNELDGGKDLYRIIMEPCWSIQPKKRPSFTEITDQLRNALDGKDLEEYQMFEEKYAERKKLFNSKFSKMETAKGEYITVGDQKNEKKNDPETDAHGYIITK